MSNSHSSYTLDTSGRITLWGANGVGQLGLGTTEDALTPRSMPLPLGIVRWTMVAAGRSHTLALAGDGRLFGWGSNNYGEVGQSKLKNYHAQPMPIVSAGGVASFVEIAAGYGHSLAIGADGKLYAWGNNTFGQLGLGSTTPMDTSSPAVVAMPAGVTSWSAIGAGMYSSFALGNNGVLYAWGYNATGLLGVGDMNQRNQPTAVANPAGVTWRMVVAGENHTLALTTDGNLYGWGDDSYGQTALGDAEDQTIPRHVSFPPGVTSWSSISAGGSHSAAIGSDGRLYAIGRNDDGQIGKGDTLDARDPYVMPFPAGVTSWRSVSLGLTHTLAVASNGRVYAWGGNVAGQIGDGSRIKRTTPVLVDTLLITPDAPIDPPDPLDSAALRVTTLDLGTTVNLWNSWFVSTTHGWVVGEGGRLWTTIDGGASWRLINTGVTATLYGVRVIGSTWFVYGANGTLRYSTDGGVTWTNGVVGSSETFYGAWFLNASYGYVVGSGGAVYLWNGTTFIRQTLNVSTTFHGVHIVGGITYVVGSGGTLYRYDGYRWIRISLGVTIDIRDVQFFDESFGYIVGADGRIMRTIDGGLTWITLTTNVNVTFRSIRVVSRLVAWAVGDGGVLLQTTDGGLTWVRVDVGLGVSLTSIVFVDGVGYVFGGGGSGIRFTSDLVTVYAGTTFTRLTLNTTVRLNRTVFVSALIGYVIGDGGTLLRTTDGGMTWTVVVTGVSFELTSIRVVGNAIYVMGARGYFAVSYDGGLTWQRIDLGVSITLHGAYFINANQGFVVGAGGTIFMWNGARWIDQSIDPMVTFTAIYGAGRYVYAVGLGGIVYRFDGVNWIEINLGITFDLHDVHFLDAYLGFMVGANGVVFRTVDGGITWVRLTTGVSVRLRSVRVLSRLVAIAVGDGGVVLRTIDGGATWIRIDLGASFVLTSIDVIDGIGYIVGSGGVAYSFRIDGVFTLHGLTFTRLSLGGLRIDRASFASRTVGVVVGAPGTLRTTIDGGITWITATIGVSIDIVDVVILQGTIIVVGADGVVLRSVDNGVTWSQFSLGLTVRLTAAYFITPDDGYVVGAGGIVYHWNGTAWRSLSLSLGIDLRAVFARGGFVWVVGVNGAIHRFDGTAWLRLSSGVSVDLTDIVMFDASFGYCVGARGTILRTFNGGITWTALFTGVTVDVRSLFVYSREIAWAVCDGGIVLQTLDGGASWQSISIGSDDVLTIDFIDDTGWVFGASGLAYAFTSEYLRSGETIYGRVNRSVRFDGIDGWLDLGSRTSFDFGSCFTLESWIRPSAFHDTVGIVGNFRRTEFGGSGYALLVDGSGRLGMVYAHDNGVVDYVWSPQPIALDAWSHVAGQWDGRTMRLFVDGVDVARHSVGGAGVMWIVDNSMAVARYFGNDRGYFTGEIDEVRIWNLCRTLDDLRRGTYLRLDGSEQGLISYLRLDEGAGVSSVDVAGIGLSASLHGGFRWLSSTARVGIGRSWRSFAIDTRRHYYNGTDVRIDFDGEAHTEEIVLTSHLNEVLTAMPAGVIRVTPRSWTLRAYRGATFSANLTFFLGRGAFGAGDIRNALARLNGQPGGELANLRLFYQRANGTGAWLPIGRVVAIDTVAGSVTFGPVVSGAGGFTELDGRFIIGTVGDSPLDGARELEILAEQEDFEVCEGDTMRVTFAVNGRNLRYTWRRNGEVIGVAGGPELRIDDADRTDDGVYEVSVVDQKGDVLTTRGVRATVTVAPRVLADPANARVVAGRRMILRADFEGTGLSYQWRHNGVDIPGANAPVLEIAAVDSTMAGLYRVLAWNNCGGTGTLDAVVTILDKEDISGVATGADRGIGRVVVSPTPAHDVVSLTAALEGSLARSSSVDVALIDQLGRTVYTARVAIEGGALRTTIDVSSIAAGAYVCRIAGADGASVTTRVIVRR